MGATLQGSRSSAGQGPLEREQGPPLRAQNQQAWVQAQPTHPAEHEQPWRRHMASWPQSSHLSSGGNGWGLETGCSWKLLVHKLMVQSRVSPAPSGLEVASPL